jgi:two-component system nitrogen regulation response regulator NtrX
LEVPPLRERKEDLPDLIEEFLKEYALKTGTDKKSLDPRSYDLLREYDWPGNVRELKNLIERLVIMTPGAVIAADDLPGHLTKKLRTESPAADGPAFLREKDFKEAKIRFEKEFILRKLQEYQGNITQTAEALGIERSHLHKKIKAYGIKLDNGD